MNLMAADIGGTKTLLMLARGRDGRLECRNARRFESGAYLNFESMLSAFLAQEAVPFGQIRSVCLAVAGPVQRHGDGRTTARLTNLPWELDSASIAAALNLETVRLINDFEGVAYSLSILPESALATLNRGQIDPSGPKLLIGAGTGLGVCAICPDSGTILPGEGGHSGFAPTDNQQARLREFVAGSNGRCSREDLLSGRGLARIAAFLESEGRRPGPTLKASMQSQDPAAALTRHALLDDDPLARDTLRLFVRIYGAQAGDLALAMLPSGGVYVAGGIAPRILPLLQNGDFMAAFANKAPMSHLMTRLPVRVVTDPQAGLTGAVRRAALDAGT